MLEWWCNLGTSFMRRRNNRSQLSILGILKSNLLQGWCFLSNFHQMISFRMMSAKDCCPLCIIFTAFLILNWKPKWAPCYKAASFTHTYTLTATCGHFSPNNITRVQWNILLKWCPHVKYLISGSRYWGFFFLCIDNLPIAHFLFLINLADNLPAN